ncbi:MAG: ferrous iron transporter B [Candidatus Omnitrophica bacterium]|nr:ferrous iron transporter B [Candidatus Omnitrophota bacterium]
MIKKIFLIGNPNVGKSVVFSRLTGVNVISSNYPGTTVGITKGYLKLREDKVEIIDLPGSYSLEPGSQAEEVAVALPRDFPRDQMVIINIIDATNLERNLYLTLQLIEEGYPLVVCLNMCDDMKHRGIAIDTAKLEALLGTPVVETCALTGQGIKLLIERILEAGPGQPQRRSSQERWLKIGEIVSHTQRLTHRHHTLREMLEDVSMKPFAGVLIASAVLYFSFKFVRFIAEGLIASVFDPFFFNIYQPVVSKISGLLGGEGFLHHILIGELLNGRIDFKQSLGLLTTAPYIEFDMVLPYIISFYFVLSILEDVGYLPRLAILLDNFLHRIGLHGFTIIPVLLGFGCNVPGILSTRILESRRERFIASTLISIGVPCVALQAMIVGLLGQFSGFYIGGVYLVLFSVWLILGVILNKTLKGFSPELLLEIPPYRLPQLAVFMKKLFLRIKGFLIEALPVVLLGVSIVNILVFFKLFNFVSGIFAPLIQGLFGLPKETVIALLIGFIRKDVAAGMLLPLGLTAKQMFIAAVLLSISFPCVATFVIMLKELGIKDFLKSLTIMIITGLTVGGVLNLAILR